MGDTQEKINKKLPTPNGIDIDPTIENKTVLVVGQPRNNSIVRITMPKVELCKPKQISGFGGRMGAGLGAFQFWGKEVEKSDQLW